MAAIKRIVKNRLERIRGSIVDDNKRKTLIFFCMNLMIGAVSAFMTIVNIFTGKWLLMWATLLFALACLCNHLIARSGRLIKQATALFMVEALILCCFFCISGTPEGFSALWTCFIPSFMLTLLGVKLGSLYSGIGFLMLAGLFWTDAGRAILQYAYTQSFMLRFPMIYFAFYIVALILEIIRAETQKRLEEAEKEYQYMYKHDALTKIYNRYGFNECFDAVFAGKDTEPLALMILDIDKFKTVNDTYGHDSGDVVLRFVAEAVSEVFRENAAVCRWGGEEFAAIMWKSEHARELVERLRREIESAVIIADEKEIHVTISAGLCEVADRTKVTIPMMVRCADKCLYEAKDTGRNRVICEKL